MKVVENIYEGYALTHDENRDSEGTEKAVKELWEMIERIIPVRVNGRDLQNELFSVAIILAEQTEKQGFIAGFQYAMNISLECQEGKKIM